MNIDGELDEAIEKLQRASKKLEEDQDKNDFVKHFEPSAFDQLGANRLQNVSHKHKKHNRNYLLQTTLINLVL